MDNYNFCEVACSGNSTLTYPTYQIGSFQTEWALGGGDYNNSAYTDENVFATDYIEDQDFNGFDYQVTDNNDIFVFSGHGGNPSNPWGETFVIPTCHANSPNYSCLVDIEDARLGEYFGKYSVAHRGFLRWGMFLTCFSVDTSPDQQWGQTQWYGMDYVMGYRGESADSLLTENVPGNFVDNAFIHNSYSFKSQWFNVADVDWITGGDNPSVFAPGVGASDAEWRRDNETQNTTARYNAGNTTAANSFAWSWAD